MDLAKRVNRLRESATLAMAKKAEELKLQGKDIISFSLGEPDFDTPPHIVQAAKQALDDGFTHYTNCNGIPELREAIARKCREENKIELVRSDSIMVTVAKHAIYCAIMSAVDKRDEVIIPNPGWVSYSTLIHMAGGKMVPAKVDIDNDFRMLPDQVNELVKKGKTSVIILNSPSNPTGGVSELSDLKGIAEIALDNDLIVISDEIYEKVLYEGVHHSIASLDGMFDRTYTINGFSKAYAMTGWRCGWVAAPKDLLRPLQLMQQQSLTCATSFVQKAAVAALDGPKKPVNDMVEKFRQRRDVIVKEMNGIDGVHIKSPKGAFYAFMGYDYDVPSKELAMNLLDYGIASTQGSAFGEFGEYHLRFSYANSMENIVEGIKRLRIGLEDMNPPLRK